MVTAPEPAKGALYLLTGKESFLKKEFIQNLRTDGVSCREFHSENDSLNEFLDFAGTSSFFESKKVAVLWSVGDLPKADRGRLASFINAIPASCSVVLESEETASKRNDFLTELFLKAKVVTCHTPFDRDLPRWVETRAKKRGKAIAAPAVQALISQSAKNLSLIDASLEELSLYAMERERIELADVETLLGRSAQSDAFLLMDFILDGKKKEALFLVGDILKSGKRAFEIVGMLQTQWERLRKAVHLMENGASQQEIGNQLRVHSFFLEKFMRQVRQVKAVQFDEIARQILACDQSLKRSLVSERLGLEKLVLEEFVTLKN